MESHKTHVPNHQPVYRYIIIYYIYMGVSSNGGTPRSSILKGCPVMKWALVDPQ